MAERAALQCVADVGGRRHRRAAPRPSRARRLACLPLIALALVAVSCDGERAAGPLAPEGNEDPPQLALECAADVGLGTLSCAVPSPSLPAGAQGALMLGGQGINVMLVSENICFEDACDPAAPPGVFQAEVSVQNLIGQAIGTVDGTDAHEDGVRVFFHSGPVVLAMTDGKVGTAEVLNGSGTGTFTGSDQPFFQYDEVLAPNATSAKQTWQWQLSPNVQSFEFGVLVSAEVEHPDGWVEITPAVDTLVAGAPDATTTQLAAVVRDMIGAEVEGDTVTWSSGDPAKLTVDSTGLVTALGGAGWVTVTATAGERTGAAEIFLVAYVEPIGAVDDVFPHTVLGNVSVTSGASGFSATANDQVSEDATVTFVGWGETEGKTEHGGDVTMTASGEEMGEFTYDPPAGYEGTDAFLYVVSDGVTEDTATVTLTVAGRIWFIDSAAPSCTSVAAGCGRLSSPFSSLGAFEAANDGAGNNPGDGDVVFLRERGADYVGPIQLRAGQKLIGQGATESLQAITGLNAPVGSTLPAMDPYNVSRVRVTGGAGGIVLGTDNTLRGLTVGTSGGTGIEGHAFGTLTLAGDVELEVTNGPALELSNGNLAGPFRSISTLGGANGIVLSDIGGTFEVTGAGKGGTGGVLQHHSGDAIVLTNTGPVSLSFMDIRSSRGNGIRGNSVAGFTLRRSTIDDSGDAEDEHGVWLTQLTGAARIDTVLIRRSYHDEVYIANSSGTLNLEMHGNDISNLTMPANTPLRDGGVRIEATGTAEVNVVLDDNTIGNHVGYNFRYAARGAGGGNVTVTNNRLGASHGGGIEVLGGLGDSPGVWSGTLTYDVANNSSQGANGAAVAVGARGSSTSGSARGFVRGNTFGAPDVEGACGEPGLRVHGDGDGEHVSSVTNNVFHKCGGIAIQPLAEGGTGRHDLILQGNTATIVQAVHPDASFPETFHAKVGRVNSGDTNTMCLVAGHPTDPKLKNSFDHRVTTIGTEDFVIVMGPITATLLLEGYLGASEQIPAEEFLSSRNTYRGEGPASVLIDMEGANLITGGACARP